jgi:hypothetical protein
VRLLEDGDLEALDAVVGGGFSVYWITAATDPPIARPSPRLIGQLQRALPAPHRGEIASAMLVACREHAAPATPQLVAALAGDPVGDHTALRAAWALHRIGTPPAPDLQEQAVIRLLELHQTAWPEYRWYMNGRPWLICIRALGTVGAGSARAREILQELATDQTDPATAAAAALALARQDGRRAGLALLRQYLTDELPTAGPEILGTRLRRLVALAELEDLGPAGAELWPEVLTATRLNPELGDGEDWLSWWTPRQACMTLRAMGPAAAGALPALEEPARAILEAYQAMVALQGKEHK